MGRRRNAQWPELGKTTRHAGAVPKHDSREALWESYVRYDDGKRQLSVAMAGWAMGDQEIDHWCIWFSSYLQRITGGHHDQIWAKEINFAENQLTAVGARRLLDTLAAEKVYAFVLKLHHNQLEDGACVADFVTHCQGSLRELHLSHNEMSTEAAAEIILAAASVRDDNSGAFCYPCRSGGHSAAPLWLRLEQNYVAPSVLANLTDPPFEEIRSGKVLCNVSSRACTPHCCVKHRIDPPPVHAKHLSNQRTKSASPNPAAGAKDLLTILRSGMRDDNVEKRQKAGNSSASAEAAASGENEGLTWKSKYQNGAQGGSKTGAPDADAGRTLRSLIGKEPAAAEAACVVAKVLRWDDDLLKWVHDVIEIPEEPQKATEESGRVKLSQELGHQLGNELKNLLGGNRSENGSAQHKPSSSTSFTTSGAHVSKDQGSSRMHATGSDYSGRQGGAMDDEPEHSYRSNRRGRRGSQPSGSEVKQVNSTMLNPAAKEFVPNAPQRMKALELNLQAATFAEEVESPLACSDGADASLAAAASASTSSALNPEAAEFKPTNTTVREEIVLKPGELSTDVAEAADTVTGIAVALEQVTQPMESGASETGMPQDTAPQDGAASEGPTIATPTEEAHVVQDPDTEPGSLGPPSQSPPAGHVSSSNGKSELQCNGEHEESPGPGGPHDTDDNNWSTTALGKGIFSSAWTVLSEAVGLAPTAGEAKTHQSQ